MGYYSGDMMSVHSKEVRDLLAEPPENVRIAVVGASATRTKYGNRIVRDLAAKGYDVIPIHPSEDEVEGFTAYEEVEDVPGEIDIVNFVVPPHVTKLLLTHLNSRRFPVVWLQPGSFNDEVALLARKRFATPIDDACIMAATNR